jgi:uncharacterized membrane protein
MNNKIMFFIGLVIFVVYMFFLLSIITKQHKIQKNFRTNDVNDFDGIGNQGRIPNKRN